jgi:hypothetical protein
MHLLLFFGLLLACEPVYAEVAVVGRVVEENGRGVPSASVRFRPAQDAAGEEVTAIAGEDGDFKVQLPRAGAYAVSVAHPGFFLLDVKSLEVIGDSQLLEFVLNHATGVSEAIEVRGESGGLHPDLVESKDTLTSADLINLPFRGRDIGSALNLMPGVVQDSFGSVHLSGSAVNQVLYTLDGFNITDPISGTLEARLNVDGVRSIDYSSGRYSPEFGKGSAGVVAINTHMGTDRWQYNATNFVPGVDTASGLHIGAWSPRVEVSGPIVKRRIWFSESSEAVYSMLVVPDVAGRNRTPSMRVDNLLRTQINATSRDLLFASFLANATYVPGSGLGALDPYSTTVNRRSRTWFTSFKHDHHFAGGALFEWGYAEYRALHRQIPQGVDYYQMTPYGRRGNFFVNSTERSIRRQFLTNLLPRTFHLGGVHQLKAGTDMDRVDYDVVNRRTGYEQFGLNHQLLSLVTFGGSGVFSRPNLEASSYLVDSWKVRPWLNIEAGIRQDWDELLRNVVFSPRLAVAASPFGWKNTRLAAGYAVTRDSTSLAEFSRPLDQYGVTVNYDSTGQVLNGPAVTWYRIGNWHLKTPLYRNWTASVEQTLPRRTTLRVNYQRKRSQDGLTYLSEPATADPSINAIFDLHNFRRDIIDSAGVSVRQEFGKHYEWMASYTRSRALSNSVISLSVDEPLWVPNNVGRMPWDSPNHILGWGYFPTPWSDWSVACLADLRDGFPFSVMTDYGAVVGAVNSHRYPDYFNLEVHLERRLRLGKRRVALRGGFTNITNHQNPTAVNNIIGGPEFLQFYGSQTRHLVFRLRWLGTGEY